LKYRFQYLTSKFNLYRYAAADYARIAADAGLVDVRTEDWSKEVSPFWRAVIDTALTWEGFTGRAWHFSQPFQQPFQQPLQPSQQPFQEPFQQPFQQPFQRHVILQSNHQLMTASTVLHVTPI
jgi:hypothetical protein